MGVLLTVNPVLRFPYGVFQITDQMNGPHRGTWFFRSKENPQKVFGPYLTESVAAMDKQIFENAK